MEKTEVNDETSQTVLRSEHEKCPSCGGEMCFDPDSGKLSCPYCGHAQAIRQPAEKIPAHDYQYEGETAEEWGKSTVTLHCANCGATVTVDRHTTAAACAFCGTPMTVQNDPSAKLLPDAVLPFQISKKEAVESFKGWIKGRFFSPGKLRALAHMEKMDGVYLPHFLFDCITSSDYTAEAGTHYYETEWVTVERNGEQVQEEQQVQRTRWEPVEGSYADLFSELPVNASKNVDRNLISLHFDLKNLKSFSKEFLYGFQAEQYSKSKDDCWIEARNTVENLLSQRIIRKIGADEVRGLSIHTQYKSRKFKYALFPVWISSYSFRNKPYKFMINGQSGETKGQAPLSAPRILVSILLAVGIPVCLFFVNHIFGIVTLVIGLLTLAALANPPRKKIK